MTQVTTHGRLDIRRDLDAPSIPTTGTFLKGDIIWNSSPSPGGFTGWTCTTAGDITGSGVLKGFGTIAS